MQCIEFPLKGMEFDAVHRIPVERQGLSMGIRCTASNLCIACGNSMQCIGFQLKRGVFVVENCNFYSQAVTNIFYFLGKLGPIYGIKCL